MDPRLTFLNGLAELINLLPQKGNQSVNRQPNRGGITSAQSTGRGKIKGSRTRGLTKMQKSYTDVTSSESRRGGALSTQVKQTAPVQSQGGALATQPQGGAMQQSSRGALVANRGLAKRNIQPVTVTDVTEQTKVGGGQARGQLSPGQGQIAGSSQKALAGGGRTGNPLVDLIAGAGLNWAADEFVRKPLTELIYQGAAQDPNTAAGMGLVDEQGTRGLTGEPLTRFADPNAVGPPAPQGPPQPRQQVEAEADAAQEVAPRQQVQPEPKLTKRQQQAQSLNAMYHKARKEAMAIEDPMEREIALEAVALMGLEFHKEYYGKSDPAKGRL